jgi:hypothetical protein
MNRYYGAHIEAIAGSYPGFVSNTFRRQEFFKLRQRQVESCRIDIDKKRLGANSNDRTCRGKEGKRCGNNGVARSDP